MAPVSATTAATAPKTSPATVQRFHPLIGTGRYATYSSRQVVTITAYSHRSTVGAAQRWPWSATHSWQRVGRAFTVHLRYAGLTDHSSEWLAETPIGSFTITQAFGRDANTGHRPPTHRLTGMTYIANSSPATAGLRARGARPTTPCRDPASCTPVATRGRARRR